jgi:glycosyltransferase involved in cell wall biosynthesis
MKIAILGTRGIPARYGGFETFAEHLSRRLVSGGHDVTVYARRPFGQGSDDRWYEGVRVRTTPTIMNKYLETPLHALTSFLDLFRHRVDAVLLCNAANSPFAWLVRLCGIPLAVNVDGIERHRTKWSAVGKGWYRLGEMTSMLFADRVIADARAIASYYTTTYAYDPEIVAYGASVPSVPAGETCRRFGLTPRGYFLYVSRLEPENNALGVIRAYNALDTEMPLVIVGDAPYSDEYKEALRREASSRVRFTGYQFGDGYHELQSNCYCYIQATEVGGTHPALIEAMAHGNCVIANGTPENFEVLGGAGEYYHRNDFAHLTKKLALLLEIPGAVERYRALARARASRLYTWEKVTAQYEQLFDELLGTGTSSR